MGLLYLYLLPGQNVSYFVMGVVSLEAACEVNNSNRYGHLNLLLHFDGSPQYEQCLTYLFIPGNRVLPDKLIGFQVVKKFPSFYGT